MLFSARIGITPMTKPLQLDNIDEDLRNSLWNVYDGFVIEPLDSGDYYENQYFKYTSIANANIHLRNALTCISNKENPDYRNSIKESISAVEMALRVITKENTLGDALKKIENKGLKINNQLKESFNKVYSYSNDKNSGIRHAVVGDHEAPDYETAKYILVTSSAFINYLVGLSVKVGLFS